MRTTMAFSSSKRRSRMRKGIDSGIAFRMNGTSSTGAPAARNTDCQPYDSISPLPSSAASTPPTE